MGIIMAVAQHHGNYKLQLFCGSANFKRKAAEEDPVKYCTRSCKKNSLIKKAGDPAPPPELRGHHDKKIR